MTLVKEVPPFRVYAFDLAFVPLCVVAFLANRPRGFVNQKHPLDNLFLGFLGAATVSFLFSYDRSVSVVGWMDWIRIVVFYFVVRRLFVAEISDKLWERLLIGLGVGLLGVGLLQLVTGTPIGLVNNYFGTNLDQSSSATVQGHGTNVRISGTTSNPIVYGLWLNLYCVFAMIYALSHRHKIWFAVLALLVPVSLLGTLTRGAIVAYVASILALMLFTFQKSGKVVVGAIVLLIVLSPVYVMLNDTVDIRRQVQVLTARFQLENNERWELNRIGVELLSDPNILLFGTGSGNFSAVTRDQAGLRSRLSARMQNTRTGIHNVWLKMIVENGVFVLIFFVMIMIECVKMARRLLRAPWGVWHYTWGVFWSIKILVYLLVESNLYESAMSYQFLLPFVAIIGYLATKESCRRIERRPAVTRSMAVAGGVGNG